MKRVIDQDIRDQLIQRDFIEQHTFAGDSYEDVNYDDLTLIVQDIIVKVLKELLVEKHIVGEHGYTEYVDASDIQDMIERLEKEE